MTFEQGFLFALIAVVFALLIWGRVRFDLVAFGALIVAVLGGVVPADAAFAGFGPLGRAQYLEIVTFLYGYLLHSQGDRMLMAHSVEGRFPFLDVHVAEFAARLPERLRLRDMREKHLLRQAVAPVLPAEITARPKRPYRAPILRALVGPEAPAYVRETLAPDRLEAAGLLQPEAVTRLLAKAERYLEAGLGEGDEMALVGALSTQLLWERLVERPRSAPRAIATRAVRGAIVHVGRRPDEGRLPGEAPGGA